jgi:6-phosphogluconolactonase
MSTSHFRTFVYVTNSLDGDIGSYELLESGELKAGPKVPAAPNVMPMAVNLKSQLLYVASRSKPFTVLSYKIDPSNGALTLFDQAPLADNFAYISLDQEGKNLFAASYGSALISVNAISPDGRVGHVPSQIIPVGPNAHSIRVDATNRHVFVPSLGSDEVFQFNFDANTGILSSNTPAALLTDDGSGPRHFIFSKDNRFIYLLSEFAGTVTTFSLSSQTGLLKLESIDSILPPGSNLKNGKLSASNGNGVGAAIPACEKIWAADIHLTPNGHYFYASERTNSTITAFRVNEQTGKLSYLSSIETEKQPRGFAIDPSGRFLIVAGELSDAIASYSIDQETGDLKLVNRCPSGRGSNWVEIMSYPSN